MQSGFRKARSTTDHLVRLETFVREAFIQKQHAAVIFFDLEKAYDTTWKYGILKDLRDAGLRGRLPLLFVYAWVLIEPHHHQVFAYLQMNVLYTYDAKNSLYNIVWNFQLPAIIQYTILFLIVFNHPHQT